MYILVDNHLIKILHSFDQHRIINLLDLSTFSFFNFVNICNTQGWIAGKKERESQTKHRSCNKLHKMFSSKASWSENLLNHQIQDVCCTAISTTLLISIVLTGGNICEFHISHCLKLSNKRSLTFLIFLR